MIGGLMPFKFGLAYLFERTFAFSYNFNFLLRGCSLAPAQLHIKRFVLLHIKYYCLLIVLAHISIHTTQKVLSSKNHDSILPFSCFLLDSRPDDNINGTESLTIRHPASQLLSPLARHPWLFAPPLSRPNRLLPHHHLHHCRLLQLHTCP